MPFGHLPVQGFQGGDGAVHDVDVKQPLEIRVAIDGVPGGQKRDLIVFEKGKKKKEGSEMSFLICHTHSLCVSLNLEIAQNRNCE